MGFVLFFGFAMPYVMGVFNRVYEIVKMILMLAITALAAVTAFITLIICIPKFIAGIIKVVVSLCRILKEILIRTYRILSWLLVKAYWIMNAIAKFVFKQYRRVPHFVEPFDLFMSEDKLFEKYPPAGYLAKGRNTIRTEILPEVGIKLSCVTNI